MTTHRQLTRMTRFLFLCSLALLISCSASDGGPGGNSSGGSGASTSGGTGPGGTSANGGSANGTSSGGSGKAVSCARAKCSAAMTFDGNAGWYTLRVQYFDQNTGNAKYRVQVGDQAIDEWTAADRIPTKRIDSSSSTRRTIEGIALRPGDRIRIEGIPDGEETAALDYLEILPGN